MADADFLRGKRGEDGGPSITLDPSLDAAIGTLANRRRRGVLYVLSEVGDELVFAADLAQKVALMDPDDPDVETVLAELYHVHLPKLAAAGFVEFDQSSGTVQYVGDDRVADLLADARRSERDA